MGKDHIATSQCYSLTPVASIYSFRVAALALTVIRALYKSHAIPTSTHLHLGVEVASSAGIKEDSDCTEDGRVDRDGQEENKFPERSAILPAVCHGQIPSGEHQGFMENYSSLVPLSARPPYRST